MLKRSTLLLFFAGASLFAADVEVAPAPEPTPIEAPREDSAAAQTQSRVQRATDKANAVINKVREALSALQKNANDAVAASTIQNATNGTLDQVVAEEKPQTETLPAKE
jgi:hypothetical protein